VLRRFSDGSLRSRVAGWVCAAPVSVVLCLVIASAAGCSRAGDDLTSAVASTVLTQRPVASSVAPTTTTRPIRTTVAANTATTAATTTTAEQTTATPAGDLPVIAWQPSHQDDTGYDDWHEYQICGDMVKRTIALAPGFKHVLAWELNMGLWGSNNDGGSNRKAFDSELATANGAHPDYFIAVHVDGAAPSGVMGMYFEGDTKSAAVATALAGRIANGVGLPLRDTRGVDLYSLDESRNDAPIRVLLEIGDNVKDRTLLEDPHGRAKIAAALAQALSEVLGSESQEGE
jgi:hypothetical protein